VADFELGGFTSRKVSGLDDDSCSPPPWLGKSLAQERSCKGTRALADD
jgi:hypothetical protein